MRREWFLSARGLNKALQGAIACFSSSLFPSAWMVIARRKLKAVVILLKRSEITSAATASGGAGPLKSGISEP